MSDETLRGRTCALAALALLAGTVAVAQVRPASVGRVTPPGAQQGSTIMLSLEGTNLTDARAVLFDDPALAEGSSRTKTWARTCRSAIRSPPVPPSRTGPGSVG